MAIVVIGGLITSTFLSLLVIPVVFTLVDGLIRRTKEWMHRRRGTASSSAPPLKAIEREV